MRGSELLGILVAVYHDEPCAHMVPISTVVRHIKIALFDGKKIPRVEMPGQAGEDEHENDFMAFDSKLLEELRSTPPYQSQHGTHNDPVFCHVGPSVGGLQSADKLSLLDAVLV